MITRKKGRLLTTSYDKAPAFESLVSKGTVSFEKRDYLIVLNLNPEVNDYRVEEPILVWEGFIWETDGDWDEWKERMGKDWIDMFYMGYDAILIREITDEQLRQQEKAWDE